MSTFKVLKIHLHSAAYRQIELIDEDHFSTSSLPTAPTTSRTELGKPRTDIADEVGGVADIFPLAQAAGVSSASWLTGRLASPGRTEPR
jgi:hypothetical protein